MPRRTGPVRHAGCTLHRRRRQAWCGRRVGAVNEQQATSDVSERLNELAHLAEACRTTFLGVAAESHWRPHPDSAAARALSACVEADPASNSDGVLAGFDLISEVVVTYLEVAAGHLGGLAALYRSGEAMFPPLPLARSVMENCAHAMWVIGDGSGRATDILARAYLEEFASCEFAKMAAGRLGSKQDDSYKRTLHRWKTIRDRAIAVFPGTTPEDLSESRPGRKIAGQVLPGPEACVSWMFNLLHKKAGGSVTERQAVGIYAFLSSGTHPSLYQARQRRILVSHSDHFGTILSVDVAFLERLLGATVMVFYGALSYVMSFYALPRAAQERLTAKIDTTLPGYLTRT